MNKGGMPRPAPSPDRAGAPSSWVPGHLAACPLTGFPSALPAADEVRTVFITGFPEDVRERELNNMLRFLPGYEVRPRWERQRGRLSAHAAALRAVAGPPACRCMHHRRRVVPASLRALQLRACSLFDNNGMQCACRVAAMHPRCSALPGPPLCRAFNLQASQMHFRNGQAQGFALFASGSLARAAVDAIQNLVFDNDSVLRAEMAHKNMWVLRRAALLGAAPGCTRVLPVLHGFTRVLDSVWVRLAALPGCSPWHVAPVSAAVGPQLHRSRPCRLWDIAPPPAWLQVCQGRPRGSSQAQPANF